jgi:uncharacterized membrane protein
LLGQDVDQLQYVSRKQIRTFAAKIARKFFRPTHRSELVKLDTGKLVSLLIAVPSIFPCQFSFTNFLLLLPQFLISHVFQKNKNKQTKNNTPTDMIETAKAKISSSSCDVRVFDELLTTAIRNMSDAIMEE